MKKINIIMTIIGFLGMLLLSVVAISDKNAKDIVSAIPLTILFGCLFVSGYIKLDINKK